MSPHHLPTGWLRKKIYLESLKITSQEEKYQTEKNEFRKLILSNFFELKIYFRTSTLRDIAHHVNSIVGVILLLVFLRDDSHFLHVIWFHVIGISFEWVSACCLAM